MTTPDTNGSPSTDSDDEAGTGESAGDGGAEEVADGGGTGKAAAKKGPAKKAAANRGSADDSGGVIFPVGHYMGPFFPSRDGPAKHHIVRVGWETPKLPDEEHLDIWALAHGLPALVDDVAWTRQAIIDAAADAEMPNAAEILDNLAELGLIVEVSPGTDQAREFAESFRLQSLLIGLGNSPDDPILDGIGLVGIPAVIKVRPRIFEIWQWAHLWPTIWAACEGLAYVSAQGDNPSPDTSTPEKVLDTVLEAMRTLISRNAAYLDVAITPSAEDGSAR